MSYNTDELFLEGWRASLVSLAAATDPLRVPFEEGDIPRPARHMTYVQIIARGGFFASCMTCGSEPFRDRRTLAEAEMDAKTHGELRHNYSRAFLVQHDQILNQQQEE